MAITADRVTNVPVPFHRLRKKDAGGVLQAGIVGSGSLRVAQRAAGAIMAVDVAAGEAWVPSHIDTPDGLVHCYSDAVGTYTVTASHATLPRVDYVLLQYNDSALGAGVGGDAPTIRVLAGTPTAGAQATNPAGTGYLTGAPAMPPDALLLTALTVPAAATSIVNANILDRRRWARGAFWNVVVTSGNVSVTSTTIAMTGGLANTQTRIECSGVPLRIRVSGRFATPAAANAYLILAPMVDGAAGIAAFTDQQGLNTTAAATEDIGMTVEWTVIPVAGSHLFAVGARVTAGTGTVFANTSQGLSFTIEEIVRDPGNNGTV